MEMAEEAREDTAGAAPVVATQAGQQPQYPKGIVLDKDGKPCRSCTSGAAFSAWTAQAKQNVKGDKTSAVARPTTMTTTAEPTTSNPQSDCPPDVEMLGRSSWTLLHTIAATYPDTPSRTQQSDMLRFVDLFSKLYPCWVCAEDFQSYIAKKVPKVSSRDEFGQWLCGAHNDVNRKLGKQVFDCSKWLERWKTGPKDGRCD